MSTFEKAKVVMLPTNKPSKLGDLATYKGYSLAKVIKEGVNPKNTTLQFWNLYIISDDEITSKKLLNTNDYYYIRNHYNEWYVGKFNGVSFDFINNDGNFDSNLFVCKKVIATTDTLLKIEINGNRGNLLSDVSFDINLPQPSQQFIEKYIEEYNKGNVITDVLVEYEYLLDDRTVLPYWNLKVNTKDNTITIKKLKETYTKEELCQILENLTFFIWKEVGIHYPVSLGIDAKDKFINNEL